MERNQDAMELIKIPWQDSDSLENSLKKASNSMDINVNAMELLKIPW